MIKFLRCFWLFFLLVAVNLVIEYVTVPKSSSLSTGVFQMIVVSQVVRLLILMVALWFNAVKYRDIKRMERMERECRDVAAKQFINQQWWGT